ncbi:hypothetical protein [Ileibacterium valens]|uniref:Uncharacterized protein n=1 Tax=Ileibacterium valens TaxID=1862668 RepID=A0A1U7NDY5_9FIRM|nr:hypothetical protein [Ileibacterium valens]OLU37527.1 hypothetical protein BO222_10490 [Ileibacterium valens]OLU39375.1 hypothetical protein BM735_07585 [Erysipelotrichaceae bacterium NYU-BL-F16]OLU42080.1 hypothetical protein BO224_02505 [Erysipelotrichaceae bacterium NYU-BL-E8]
MVIDYIKGFLFLTIYFLYIYLLGSIYPNDNSFYKKIIYGYLTTSLMAGILGVITQILFLPWSFFAITMTIWHILAVLLGLLMIKEKKVNLFRSLLNDIKKHYFLFLLIFILLFLQMGNYPGFWLSNHLDDGFYLSKIGIPWQIDDFHSENLVSGFGKLHHIDSYSLNTHELEYGYYLSLIRIPTTLFARFFMAWINLLITCCTVSYLSEILFRAMRLNFNYPISDYATVILIVFLSNEVLSREMNLIDMQDMNQISSAFYYGSVLVRMVSFIWLIAPFIKKKKINLSLIIKVLIISFVLLTKSGVALPLIITCIISYLFVFLLFRKSSSKKSAFILLAVVVLGNVVLYMACGNIPLLMPIKVTSETSVHLLNSFIKKPIFILFLISFIGSFIFKSKLIYKYNLVIVVCYLLIGCPILNTFTAAISIYPFVLARATAALTCFIAFTAWIYLLGIIFYIVKSQRMLMVFGDVSTALLSSFVLYTYGVSGGAITGLDKPGEVPISKFYEVIFEHPALTPKVTVEIGNILNEASKELGQRIVLSNMSYVIDNVDAQIPLELRLFSPDSIILCNNHRYPQNENPEFGSFSLEDLAIYDAYISNPDDVNEVDLKSVIDQYKINTLITENSQVNFSDLGFHLYGTTSEDSDGRKFYVYVK